MNLIDLRAISEGCDIDEVENIGGYAALYEINTGAIQSIKHAMAGNTKEAKALMVEAKILARDGKRSEARKKLDKAIALLKQNRREAEEIDDDGILEHILIASVMSIVPTVGSLAYSIGYYISWYHLRQQAAKGDTYSNRKATRSPNLIKEALFGPLRAAGYSRSVVLAGYDKLIEECEMIKRNLD